MPMEWTANLRKMESEAADPVRYRLVMGEERVEMTDLIGKEIHMHFLGQIHCLKCGRETRKSFAQGYCYPCFTTAPECEACVLRPELCQAHEGIARDLDYAREHCLIEHVVYLSLTSGLKVGVTRHTQVPTRWIDQGATCAIELARTPNRYLAGLMEVALKAHVADKTNWRKMLNGPDNSGIDLLEAKSRMAAHLPEEFRPYISPEQEIQYFHYPVEEYPKKIKSLNLDKEAAFSGILKGIKGQYLMLDGDRVINIRKFGAYRVRFSC